MDLRQNKMESLLATLGDAREAGVFTSEATRYPWRTEAVAIQNRGRRRSSWFWVGGPVAAAAAVAVLFVGPNLFPGQASSDVALNGSNLISPVQPELHADAASPNSSPEVWDCDFNGDGVVNGLDIQALADRRTSVSGDPDAIEQYKRMADQLRECMLSGS